ncbi:MAG: type I-U CRISPR-associated protein Csb2 [Planctomycetota bacterium]
MIVELNYLTGRVHATAWGRHVNEAVPEWPPSPFRVLRALVDAWYRKHSQIGRDVIERLLAHLSHPPRYLLPRARASHTRSYLSQNKQDPTDRKLVFDGFVVLDRGSKVLIGWPDLALDAEALDVAQQLFGALSYLGRSESWVCARVVEDRAVEWNCELLVDGSVAADKHVISVAGVVPPNLFAARGFEVPGKGKEKARKLPWLEALTWGSAEAIAYTMNRPPALEPLFYVRDDDALDARPAPVARLSTRVVEAVRLAADAGVRVPITDAIRIGEHVRRNLMGALRHILGSDALSSTFTGKDSDGSPARGHGHVSILSLDEDGDGFIDAVVIAAPQPLSLAEQRAIDSLRPVARPNGHSIVLTPVVFGPRDTVLERVSTVSSVTPFIPTRHRRKGRDGDLAQWLAAQVGLECERRGMPAPSRVESWLRPTPSGLARRWLDFRRARKGDAPRLAYGMRLTFSNPVLAPFSLGYASHFGAGTFVPAAP